MASISLDNLTKTFRGGVTAVDSVSLDIHDGEFMVLVGPSGCGKSTLLRMVAGLESVSDGTVSIGGRIVNDIPPRDRDIAMIFQSYALYPHMTVEENLAFGLRLRGVRKPERSRRARDVARILRLQELLERKPSELSGGQRQRVAMGRAIVREPRAFLMDESLSNLDARLRVQMRTEIADLHNRLATTTIYVTHDQVEAMTLGQRVAVMHDGVIQQVDTPQGLFSSPTNIFVASFIGSPEMNLADANVRGDTLRFRSFAPRVRNLEHLEGDVIVGLRPSAFEDASLRRSDRSIVLEIVPKIVEDFGTEKLVVFDASGGPAIVGSVLRRAEDELESVPSNGVFTARVSAESPARVGRRMQLAIEPSRLHFFNPHTGGALKVSGDAWVREPLHDSHDAG